MGDGPHSLHSQWMRVMGEGQHTRDASLRTRREIERDRALAESLARRRRELFATTGGNDEKPRNKS